MITNTFIKTRKALKISKTVLNRSWWDNLDSNWQNLLILNYELQPIYKTWFLPYFKHHSGGLFSRKDFPLLDEPISDELISKIKDVRFLDCKYMHFKDLLPIAGFKKLEYLDCSHNELKNLDAIKDLKNIKQLDCCDNPYMENIKAINNFSELRILLLHGLPNLEKTMLPSSFNKIIIMSIGSSPIGFTKKIAENIIELCIRESKLPLYNYEKLDILKLTKEEDDTEIFSSKTFSIIKENRDSVISKRKSSIIDGLKGIGLYDDDLVELMLAFRNHSLGTLNFSRVETIFKKYINPNAETPWADGSDCPPIYIMDNNMEEKQ